MLAHHKATVVHGRLAGKQAVDARRQLLRFEPGPRGVDRWRNKTRRGLGQHLWRCQHRRDQRTEPRVSGLADALHNCLLCFGVGASPGVPHTYLDKQTFTIASAPSCRDSHALSVPAGRGPHALQMACASRTMRPTVMSEPIVTEMYVHAYVIPLEAAARHGSFRKVRERTDRRFLPV